MKKLWSRTILILTMHCDDATNLASESLDRPLLFHERWALRMHIMICWSCRHFARQLRLIQDACRQAKFTDVDGLLKSIHLDDGVKQQLRARISAEKD